LKVRRINGILGELASVALTLLADACTLSANIHDSVHDENTVFIYGKQALSSSIRRQEQVNVRLIGNKNLDSLQKKMKYCSVKLKHLWPRQHLRRLKHQTKAPEHFEWGHPRLSLPQDKHWHDRQSAAISASNYERNQQKKMNMQIQQMHLGNCVQPALPFFWRKFGDAMLWGGKQLVRSVERQERFREILMKQQLEQITRKKCAYETIWHTVFADFFVREQNLNGRFHHPDELRAISETHSRHCAVAKQTNKRKLEHRKTKQINRMKYSASAWCIRWDNHATMPSVSSDQASSGHTEHPPPTKMPWLLCCGCTVMCSGGARKNETLGVGFVGNF
jgi:hypothetical protein